ncbi:hypothetical protein DAEQUDRAFT_770747 [Daedalea quercina L-15889]|uniref:Uncharacterized protein n=1 Tax=Daedalea quercina L-15889 TaxID=1314783 RepID=A0A165KLQ2_9APHY|nr:hypothetical protein DAEQUDRAFT_770747 [Daedalea quercina L-15889]
MAAVPAQIGVKDVLDAQPDRGVDVPIGLCEVDAEELFETIHPRRVRLAERFRKMLTIVASNLQFVFACTVQAALSTIAGLYTLGKDKAGAMEVDDIVLGSVACAAIIAYLTVSITVIFNILSVGLEFRTERARLADTENHRQALPKSLKVLLLERNRNVCEKHADPFLKTLGFVASSVYSPALAVWIRNGGSGVAEGTMSTTDALACGAAGTATTLVVSVVIVFEMIGVGFLMGKVAVRMWGTR